MKPVAHKIYVTQDVLAMRRLAKRIVHGTWYKIDHVATTTAWLIGNRWNRELTRTLRREIA